jgi:4-amino-4-deoxy-L-arabinose transferase-like glycosyltransferase
VRTDVLGAGGPVLTDLRGAVLAAAVCGGVLATAFTELFSLVGGLTLGGLLVAWATALAAAGLLLARLRVFRQLRPPSGWPPLPQSHDLAMVVWIATVVGLTGALALSSVPINPDSMTYHLARVAHWAENRSVAFYPTHIVRQLYPPPWAEFAVLHLFILAAGDRLVNLVQWVSMVASLVGVSAIARQLGAGRRGQLLSAFACATIPMGILQARTPQNDYAAALWLVCLVSALLAMDSRPGALLTLGAGASLGLALLTKGTSYVFAAPFVVVFVLMGRNRPLSKKLAQGLVIGLCAIALNAPQYWRNTQVFGSPLGPGAEGIFRYANDAFSPAILASNVLRNLGVHAGTRWPAANDQVERAIAVLHRGVGIALDDPRSTWPGTRFEVIPPAANEDLAGNGLHLLLIAAAMVGAWCLRRDDRLHAFAACLIAAFLLFCLLLRWQPWHSRLQLPLFVLATPLVGVIFEGLKPTLLAIALVLFGGSSVYFLTGNKAQPLMGRRAVFSMARAEQRAAHAGPAYVGAARFVVSLGCRQVGLAMSSNDREYFLWGLLADAGWRGRIEPVFVANISSELPKPSSVPFRPCAIVREGQAASLTAGIILEEQYYGPGWSRERVQVLVPALKPVAAAVATTGPPGVSLVLDRSLFRPGDRVTIGLDARNPIGGAAAELYVGIILPDGRSAVFVGPSGLLSDSISLADASAYQRAMMAPPGFALSAPTFIELPLPAGVARGTYKIFATLVRSRALRGPSVPPADLLASDIREIVLLSDLQDSGGSPSR